MGSSSITVTTATLRIVRIGATGTGPATAMTSTVGSMRTAAAHVSSNLTPVGMPAQKTSSTSESARHVSKLGTTALMSHEVNSSSGSIGEVEYSHRMGVAARGDAGFVHAEYSHLVDRDC